jgi:hypothetical protein
MSNRLITTSLIDAVDWARKAPSTECSKDPSITWRQDAYNSLVKTLSRAPWEPDGWLKRGIDFEQSVYRLTKLGVDPEELQASENFKIFLRAAKGAQLYTKSKSFIQLDGEEYCVFAKKDLYWPKKEVFPGRIADIKTTSNYGGQEKYLKTAQHKIYCMNDGVPDFEYIIGEFNKDDMTDMTIKNVFRVSYHVDSFKDIRDEVTDRIKGMIEWLKQFDEPGDLWELYLTKYCYSF